MVVVAPADVAAATVTDAETFQLEGVKVRWAGVTESRDELKAKFTITVEDGMEERRREYTKLPTEAFLLTEPTCGDAYMPATLLFSTSTATTVATPAVYPSPSPWTTEMFTDTVSWT